MTGLQHNFLLRSIKGLGALLVMIPFAITWFYYFANMMVIPYYFFGNLVVIGLFVLLFYSFGKVYDAFQISTNSIPQLIYSQLLSLLMADGVMFIVLWLLTYLMPNLLVCFITLLAQSILSAVWCSFANHWYFTTFQPKKACVVFEKQIGLDSMCFQSGLSNKFDFQCAMHIDEVLSDFSLLDNFEAIFVGGVHSHERNTVLKYCVENNIDVYVIPNIGDVIMIGAKPAHLLHLPLMRVGHYNPDPDYVFLKRFFDIVFSGIAIICLSPIILFTAIAIKLHDGGPVFYKQRRLTQNGKEFDVLKFRSMRVDAEKDGVARLSTGDKDDRITPVGRFIRKVRIDELPQLFNILGGSMSIVGPRPERPEIAAQYLEYLPEFNLRLQAKAGLTGYAQVYGKYNTTPYDKLSMDLMYIANPSLLEDLRIIFATIKILFIPESTEGIEEGKTTA